MSSGLHEPLSRPGRHRFIPPGIPKGSLSRPRLDRQLSDLFDTYSVVEIIAAPGSGKTVEAQLFAAASGRCLVWLTLDRSDVSASSLVFDLAATLDDLAAGAIGPMRRTLQASGTPEEAAAILASSLVRRDCLLVIDECQQIVESPSSASTLDMFLEYIPEYVWVLLLTRDELPWPLQKRYVHGGIAQVGDAALALNHDEIVEYVQRSGAAPASAAEILDSTGGWAAGVALACRFGMGGEQHLRDLSAYFGRQVLDALPEDEQQFLLDTSVTDAVTREVAVALCGPDGHRLWSAVSARHLPATSRTGSAIVYHSLFRSFLLQQLTDTQPERMKQFQVAHARYLAQCRRYEEATEILLPIGELDLAQEMAAKALPGLYARADWPVVERWLAVFGQERVFDDPVLIGASIRAIHDLRELEPVRSLIRRMDREGRLRAAIELDPSLLAITAWAMHAHPHEAVGLLDKYEGDDSASVVRYMIDTMIGTKAVAPPDSQGLAHVERLLSWGLFLQGRLGELGRLSPPDPESPILNPHVVLAAVFYQDTGQAHRRWLRIPQEIRERPHARFIEAMMNLADSDEAEARENLDLALSGSHRRGLSIEPVYEIFSGYLLLLGEGPAAAIGRLEPVLAAMSRAGQTAYVEMAQCFLGLSYLRAERNGEARLMLREAVASMSRCERRLLLSMAAAGLSEAEARFGHDEAAHEAAELAYRVAVHTGSFWALIQAVRIFPEIRTREAGRNNQDSRWRRLVVAPSAQRSSVRPRQPQPAGGRSVVVRPFGRQCDIYVDGEPTNIGRTKVLELLACLALHPQGIDRFELQQRLFPDADQRSGGNHFRQVAHRLRHRTGIALERSANLVRLPDSLRLTSHDIESERLLVSASTLVGRDRKDRLSEGLALVDGPYLEASTLPWVEDRRSHLELVYEEARVELATLYLELGEPEMARSICETVLETNRYSDPAYRVLAEVERSVGSDSSALAVYRRATEAMADLGLRPGDARRLAQNPPETAERRARIR